MAFPVRDRFLGYPPQHHICESRTVQPQPQNAASSLSINPYASFVPSVQQPQGQQLASRSSLSTASPASELGSRPLLPSISNLLGIADGDRSSQENDTNATQTTSQVSARQAQPINTERQPRHSYSSHDLSSSQRTAVPPTPPLRNDSVIEHTQSPSTISTGSSLSAQPYFLGSGLNNVEADHQRIVQANFIKRHSVPSQPNTSPYGASPYQTSPYTASPGNVSNGSFYSPTNGQYPVSNLYHQRPLPSNFPPSAPASRVQTAPSSAPTNNNPWEHHHYISPSSQATFPQTQDRYICQTCNKAFSRPSSLKIHSHSHTGEKPFKCPHGGCGKAFSVRSNMKRHERGCHTGGSGLGGLLG